MFLKVKENSVIFNFSQDLNPDTTFDSKMINTKTELLADKVSQFLSAPSVSSQAPVVNLVQVKDYIFDSKAVLGKGSTSTVYKGVDIRTKEVVGVKKISKRALNSEYLITSLLNEISIHTKVRHPNIVGLKDVIRSTNNIYLVLEYCNSGTLRDYLKKKEKLNERETKQILIQVIQGMNGLIQNNVIHRDIKPENILCHNERGVLSFKICDFGFSKKLAEKDQLLHSSIGSPQYMDLQRLLSEGYSSKSDVFSLGVIAHEMLFGCPPWSATNWHDLKCNLLSQPLQLPQGVLSKEMERFLKDTLAVWEKDRASWEEVKNHTIFLDL